MIRSCACGSGYSQCVSINNVGLLFHAAQFLAPENETSNCIHCDVLQGSSGYYDAEKRPAVDARIRCLLLAD